MRKFTIMFKKLLFFIALFVFSSTVFSQAFKDGGKFLFTYRNLDQFNAYEKSPEVLSVAGAKTEFTFGHDTFFTDNDKVYWLRWYEGDTVLQFDFGLEQGDSVELHLYNNGTMVHVDSVVYRMFLDGKLYKHIYLDKSVVSNYNVWIEGIGTQELSWIPYQFSFTEAPSLKAACFNDTLTYWDTSFNEFQPHVPNPICNFDSLMQWNDLEELSSKFPSIYPNPVTHTIHFDEYTYGDYEIWSMLGVKLLVGKLETDIQVAELSPGTYMLMLKMGRYHKVYPFIKE